MHKRLVALAVAASTLVAAPAFAQHRHGHVHAAAEPPSGMGLTITGGVFTSISVLSLATAPVCRTSVINTPNGQMACLVVSLVSAGISAAIGVPTLVIGVGRRGVYTDWRRKHRALLVLDHLDVVPTQNGATFGWKTEF